MKRKKLDKNTNQKKIKEVCEDPVIQASLKVGAKVLYMEKIFDDKNMFEVTMIDLKNKGE